MGSGIGSLKKWGWGWRLGGVYGGEKVVEKQGEGRVFGGRSVDRSCREKVIRGVFVCGKVRKSATSPGASPPWNPHWGGKAPPGPP